MATTLNAGDLAITGFKFDNPDQFIVYQGTTSNPRFIANEIDNARYRGPTSGSRLASITNRTNWIGSNASRQPLSNSSFSVTSGSSVHLTFGNPSDASSHPAVSNNYLLARDQYALSYNNSRRTANWVGWQLNDSWLGSAPRQNDFRPDSALPAGFFRVGADDYQGSGFDRGHLTPSADRTASVTDNSNTFFMSNIIPQAPNSNRGVWASLEHHVRTLLPGHDVYIYAGGYGTGGTGSNGFRTAIGPGIAVPARTWKTLLVVDQGETPFQVGTDDYIITVDIPNSQAVAGTSWQDYVVSVDELEQDTGYNFFSALPNTIEALLESQIYGGGHSGGRSDPSVFINEIHYDNVGRDRNEGIEIAGPAGTHLSGWSLEFYNGSNNGLYGTVNLSGTLSNQDSGHGGLFFPIGGIQNGAPDGVALVNNRDEVVQFLSYEGTITAVNGTAAGLTSENLGVSESSATPLGYSLQLAGTGNTYDDFSWRNAAANTFGVVNTSQNFI